MNMVTNWNSSVVHVLAAIFGISSWIAINGIWVQTPLLFQTLPENYNIACYLVIIVQVANIGPLIHYICTKFYSIKQLQGIFIHGILLLGCVACSFLIFFWDHITVLNGKAYSFAFLGLSGVLALVDCTSSVLYMPYMAVFKAKYLITLIIGEGLSGLLPSVFALIQGVGGNPECVTSGNSTIAVYPEPRFSVSSFFVILLVMMASSWVAYILLDRLTMCRAERLDQDTNLLSISARSSDVSNVASLDSTRSPCCKRSGLETHRTYYTVLLLTQAYLSCLSNGIIPSIQSYSCLPYGNQAYHLSVALSGMANPIACSLGFFMSPATRRLSMPVFVTSATLTALYITITALGSPHPVLQAEAAGQVLVVIAWVLFSSFVSLAKTSIAIELRDSGDEKKALLYNGIYTQVGSCVGAATILVILERTSLFTGYYACA